MARVIRGPSRVVPGEIAEAHDEAARIREAAKAELAREREALRPELERVAREAARAELAAAHVALDRARERIEREAEEAIVPIAIAVARKIVGAELESHPEHVRTLAREAIDRVRRAQRVRVRVCPAEAAVIRDLGAEVIEDDAIARGGCVVESELGEIDARLEVRLDALLAALAKAT